MRAQPLRQIARVARKHYTDLAYHNFLHALNVTARTLLLARRAKKFGHETSVSVIKWSGMMHDADFYSPRGRFASKEEKSACIAMVEAELQGVGPEECWQIHEAILGTNSQVCPRTLEAKLLRAADLANLAQPFPRYAAIRDLLCEEMGISWSLDAYWKQMLLLSDYIWPLLELTPMCFDEDGTSHWHRSALGNLFTSLLELAPQNASLVFDCNPNDPLFRQEEHVRSRLLAGLVPDEEARRELNLEMKLRHRQGGAIEVFLPGDPNRLPLPRHLLDLATVR